MALHPIPYKRLEPLVRDHLSTGEDAKTAELIRQLRPATVRRYVVKGFALDTPDSPGLEARSQEPEASTGRRCAAVV